MKVFRKLESIQVNYRHQNKSVFERNDNDESQDETEENNGCWTLTTFYFLFLDEINHKLLQRKLHKLLFRLNIKSDLKVWRYHSFYSPQNQVLKEKNWKEEHSLLRLFVTLYIFSLWLVFNSHFLINLFIMKVFFMNLSMTSQNSCHFCTL